MGSGFNPGKVRRAGTAASANLSALVQHGAGAVTHIPVDQLDPWQDEDGKLQPFRLYPKDRLQELADNIQENGILNPCLVRPRNGRYQILSGHNRTEAAKLAGLATVPCIVKEVDDDLAALTMLDSNLYQRETILPSERARAYELKMRIYRRQGYRCDLAGEQRSSAAQRVAEEAGDSPRSVNRYVRLLRLTPELLDMVDGEKIPVTAAYGIAGLREEDQDCLRQVMEETKRSKLTQAQAEEITDAVQRDGQLQPETAERILTGKGKEAVSMMRLSIPAESIPKKDQKRLKKDPKLLELVLETIQHYLADYEVRADE